MKAKAVLVAPQNYEEMVKVKHFLMSREKTFRTVNVPISDEESWPVIMTEMDLLEKVIFKLAFKAKSEKISVFG